MSPYTINTHFSFRNGIGFEFDLAHHLTESQNRTQIRCNEQIALSSGQSRTTQIPQNGSGYHEAAYLGPEGQGQDTGAAMLAKRPAGRNASALKYDILTAMGAYALGQGKGPQKLVLRFMTLITARYNWQRDDLSVGQREIARLWDVDERTVKREMAKLRGMGWLVVKRQGARGRVTEYGIDLERLLADTQERWGAVGPDFEHRMQGTDEPAPNVVPLRPGAAPPAPDVTDGHEWSLAKAVLHAEDPANYASWVQGLTRAGRAGGRLMLSAPSRFHANYVMSHLMPRLLSACRDVDDTVTTITVEA